MSLKVNNRQIALSIDVEDWYHTPAISGSSFAKFKSIDEFFKHWSGRYDYLTESTLETLSILKNHKIRATFFIVGDIVARYPKIVDALRSSDHEIGCHGMHHTSALDTATKEPFMSKEQWSDDVRKSKALLEQVFDRKVIGYRAPGAYFANWMIPELINLGFEYDSSVAYNSFYNKTNVELSDIPSHPYKISAENLGPCNSSQLVELPWSQFHFAKKIWPAGGAFFYRVLGNFYFKWAINQNLNRGDTMFYFHPLDLTREAFPLSSGRKRPLYWVNKGKKTSQRLNKLLKSFDGKWTTCGALSSKFIKNLENENV